MKDLIAKLQMDANCAMGAIWMHIDAQVARIAELESENSNLHYELNAALSGGTVSCPRASTALQAPVCEVPGYKLVPLEVTDAMLEAWKHELCIPVGSSPEAKARRAYKAMLAAAPLPAVPVQPEPKP